MNMLKSLKRIVFRIKNGEDFINGKESRDK